MVLPWIRRWLLADIYRLGRWGQKQAERRLKRDGCRILARNWGFSGGELDVVAMTRDGVLVFVEVKTRRSEVFAPAIAAVNRKKQHKIGRTAKRFLSEFKLTGRPLRFDVITVILPLQGRVAMTHYPSAFVP